MGPFTGYTHVGAGEDVPEEFGKVYLLEREGDEILLREGHDMAVALVANRSASRVKFQVRGEPERKWQTIELDAGEMIPCRFDKPAMPEIRFDRSFGSGFQEFTSPLFGIPTHIGVGEHPPEGFGQVYAFTRQGNDLTLTPE
jgi:hypothetical protein